MKRKLNEIMIKHTGKPIEQIEKDTDRDNFMLRRGSGGIQADRQVLDRLPHRSGEPQP